jgi:hypothetical protein
MLALPKTSTEYPQERETTVNPAGSLYRGQQNNHNRTPFNIMNIRTSIQDDSDD